MKKLGTALLAILLAACGGGNDTSSNAGGDSTFGTLADTAGTTASPGTNGPEAASSGGNGPAASSESSGPDGTYRGQLTATLSGDGVLPVTDSTDLEIKISGSDVTVTAEGRSYKGQLNGDSFSVKIPIDQESRGIVCKGTPVLEGKVKDGTVSGTVLGTGECSSEATSVPVSVTGEFTARK